MPSTGRPSRRVRGAACGCGSRMPWPRKRDVMRIPSYGKNAFHTAKQPHAILAARCRRIDASHERGNVAADAERRRLYDNRDTPQPSKRESPHLSTNQSHAHRTAGFVVHKHVARGPRGHPTAQTEQWNRITLPIPAATHTTAALDSPPIYTPLATIYIYIHIHTPKVSPTCNRAPSEKEHRVTSPPHAKLWRKGTSVMQDDSGYEGRLQGQRVSVTSALARGRNGRGGTRPSVTFCGIFLALQMHLAYRLGNSRRLQESVHTAFGGHSTI